MKDFIDLTDSLILRDVGPLFKVTVAVARRLESFCQPRALVSLLTTLPEAKIATARLGLAHPTKSV